MDKEVIVTVSTYVNRYTVTCSIGAHTVQKCYSSLFFNSQEHYAVENCSELVSCFLQACILPFSSLCILE